MIEPRGLVRGKKKMGRYYTCREKDSNNISGLCLKPTVDGMYCKDHFEAVSVASRRVWPDAEPLRPGELPWGGA